MTPERSPRRWNTWLAVTLIALASLATGGWLLRGVAATPDLPADQVFEQVLGTIKTYFVDSLTTDSLFENATVGMVEQLGDPYSVLLQGEDYDDLTEQTTGNYGGLGIQIDVRDGWITVVAPLPQTPAEVAGIEAGDRIVEVEGKSSQGLNQDQAVKLLRGPPGSEVSFKVRRPGFEQLLPFTIERARIHFRSVQPGVLVTPTIGLVQLRVVAETSAEEMKTEINRLRKLGMKGLILDLRRNPGGLLNQGVAVSDLFLDPGQEIVSTRGRAPGTSQSFSAKTEQTWPKMPVVVLVNQWTASAAEIISGALQDNDRAVIVGVPTFGKGLVQSLFQLGNDRALKLTTARWYTPSGRSIQRKAKNQAAQIAAVEAIADGTDTTSVDSLPTHKTISGRLVKGGGGIVPDVIVRSDTLTTAERNFVEGLGGKVSAYQDALVGTALDLKKRETVTSESFTVDSAMLAEVYSRLAAKGVELKPSQRQDGADLVGDQLGYEIARYVFGRQVELRRRANDDKQVQAAVELLEGAATPQALMSEITGQ